MSDIHGAYNDAGNMTAKEQCAYTTSTAVTSGTLVSNYVYNGIRTSKTVGGIKHEYILDGAQIVAEKWVENNDENGLKQKRHYGPDGRAEYDIDYRHGGDHSHEFPHRHDWVWSNKDNPRGDGIPLFQNILPYGGRLWITI